MGEHRCRVPGALGAPASTTFAMKGPGTHKFLCQGCTQHGGMQIQNQHARQCMHMTSAHPLKSGMHTSRQVNIRCSCTTLAQKRHIQHVGKTAIDLHTSFRNSRSAVVTKVIIMEQPVAKYFNSENCSLLDLSIIAIEMPTKRENIWINMLDILTPHGFNLEDSISISSAQRIEGLLSFPFQKFSMYYFGNSIICIGATQREIETTIFLFCDPVISQS